MSGKKTLLHTLPMPRKCRRRSEKQQQQQTKFISTVRHRSQDDPDEGHPNSKAELMRLKRLVSRFQQDVYNRDRREQRLRDKLARELGKDEVIAQIHQEHEAELQRVEAHHADDRDTSNKTINRLRRESNDSRPMSTETPRGLRAQSRKHSNKLSSRRRTAKHSSSQDRGGRWLEGESIRQGNDSTRLGEFCLHCIEPFILCVTQHTQRRVGTRG